MLCSIKMIKNEKMLLHIAFLLTGVMTINIR